VQLLASSIVPAPVLLLLVFCTFRMPITGPARQRINGWTSSRTRSSASSQVLAFLQRWVALNNLNQVLNTEFNCKNQFRISLRKFLTTGGGYINISKYVLWYSSNFTPQVKEARNQSQIFNRKSISRNTTHRQSYHLQAVLTGVKRWKANTRLEKANNLRLQRKTAQTQPRQIKQNQNVLLKYMQTLKPQNLLHK